MAVPPPARGSIAELTAALKRGLHHRRLVSPAPPREPLPAPEPLDVSGPLIPVSGLLGHPAAAKPSRVRTAVRFARRVAKLLVRPWLELQTRFNHAAIGALDQMQAWAHANLLRVHQRCHELERDLARAADAHHALAERVAECYEELLRERARVRRLADDLEALGGGRCEPPAAPPARLTDRVIETVFAHTRMPAPPAQVLDLGGPLGPPDLSAIGYQVTGVDPGERPARSGFADLPCPDAAADAAVAVGGFARPAALDPADHARFDRHVAAEVYRALRPGGRLILTAPLGGSEYDRVSLARLLAHFRTVETGYAVRSGGGWVFTAEPPPGDGPALALVVAERE